MTFRGTGGVVHVVTTYHDQPGDLRRLMRSLQAQSCADRISAVSIVDNDSRAHPAADVVGPARDVDVIHREVNDGPGGGYSTGIARFLDRAAEPWLWLIDPDCEPHVDCLENLLAAGGVGSDLLVPSWVQPDGRRTFLPAWNGTLIPRESVERLGVPRADFVWWMEDTEYLANRPRHLGLARRPISAATVVHHATAQQDGLPSWRYYYQARNAVYYRTRVHWGPTPWRRLGRALVVPVARILLRERDRRRVKLLAHLHGVIDGIRGRMGLTRQLVPDR